MEHITQDNPEQERRRALEALPAAFGYIETPQMIELRQQLVEAMRAGENTRELALRHRLLAEEMTDYDSENAGRLRIGMLVSIALMRRDGGRYDDYIEDLEDVLMMAEEEEIEDVVLLVGEVLDHSY